MSTVQNKNCKLCHSSMPKKSTLHHPSVGHCGNADGIPNQLTEAKRKGETPKSEMVDSCSSNLRMMQILQEPWYVPAILAFSHVSVAPSASKGEQKQQSTR